ncbi:hypothetical protein N5923_23500 [Erwiniaceae bacterium BAC15a-03b]|uniref:Antitermination protein n=1 Tax=Winslowiella arboricola TaxID=2978220 RepID=A0A9J6PUX5_9GAMM|nr:antitermination protein N [Winslowiella arboricola]MCU5775084.1 hypothetical protein [Winslowiella arboricola]MCU5780462.1 hypothetical protein [Winslowiella arboricola]
MNAQEKRRKARAEKQAAWKQANPLSVGVKAKPVRQVLILNRKAVDRVEKAIAVQTTKYYPSADNICLPQVAIYAAGHRKSENVTAR